MEKEPKYNQTVPLVVHVKIESFNVKNKPALLMDQLVMPMVIPTIEHMTYSIMTSKEIVNMSSPLHVIMMNSQL